MNKRFLIASAALLVVISAAPALAVTAEVTESNQGPGFKPAMVQPAPMGQADPVVVTPAAPQKPAEAPTTSVETFTVSAPEGCKFVRVSRPDVNPDKPEIYLTFRGYGGTVEAIEACNPDSVIRPGGSTVFGVVNSPTSGARVSLRTKDGVGVVGLPTILTDGSIHQVHCKMPVEGKFPFDFFKVTWKGGLPDSIDMKKSDMTDQEGSRICEAALPPNLRAQMVKK